MVLLQVRYIMPKSKQNNNNSKSNRKDGDVMTEIAQRLQRINIPPHIMREIGLKKDWKKDISPEFMDKVIKTALKYKEVLKELSKY